MSRLSARRDGPALRVLVATASKHGATSEIGQAIASGLGAGVTGADHHTATYV